MKILYLTNDISILGGIEKILLEKVKYLSKNYKYDITILTQNRKTRMFFSLNTSEKLFKIKSFKNNLQHNFFIRQIQRIIYFIELYKILSSEKYDLIISTGSLVDMFLPLIKKIKI